MKSFLTIILLISLCSIVNANIIYVDDSNTTGIENGSLQYPYNTVEEGLAAATAGDTVYVFSGIYNPPNQELFLKNGVIVQGEDSSSVEINSNFFCNEPVINQPTGIYSLKCSVIDLNMISGSSLVTVSGNRLDSIDISSGSGFTFIVENNTIDAGIRDGSGDNFTTISGNKILNGRIYDASGGLGETQFIEDNIINYTATGDPEEDFALIFKSFSATIRNNIINCTGPASGMELKSGEPTNVIDNTITLNNGIPLEGTSAIYNKAGTGVVTGNIMRGGYFGYFSRSGTVLFENNTITEAHTGFISNGAEEVKNNTITNCSGDGMILEGLRGPISRNIIKDNDSAGIRLMHPVDIGGGNLNGEGNNIIRNNGFYDLVIDYIPQQPETIYVMYNGWDHITLPEILQYDIFNEGGSPNIIINANGFYTDVEHAGELLSEFSLLQNYPNPFNPSTKIKFTIPRDARGETQDVTLKVYDVLGNEVATLVNEEKPAGKYEVEFSRNLINQVLTSGIYFYQLRNGVPETSSGQGMIQTKKMVLLK